MKFRFVSRSPIVTVAVGLLVTSACTHEPAFRAELPGDFDSAGKAIAIIGDLQQTSGLPRLIRHRENNAVEQQRLIGDLHSHVDALGADGQAQRELDAEQLNEHEAAPRAQLEGAQAERAGDADAGDDGEWWPVETGDPIRKMGRHLR